MTTTRWQTILRVKLEAARETERYYADRYNRTGEGYGDLVRAAAKVDRRAAYYARACGEVE
jgi:hypothetical protein